MTYFWRNLGYIGEKKKRPNECEIMLFFKSLTPLKVFQMSIKLALDGATTPQVVIRACKPTSIWRFFFFLPRLCPPAVANSRGEYLLNGDFVVSMFKREVRVGRAVLEYSGSDHVVERLNCTDRIEEEIVIQVHTEPGSTILVFLVELWTLRGFSALQHKGFSPS